MNKTPQRPENIPENAIYNAEDGEWRLYTYNEDKIVFGKAYHWYADGILKEEVIFDGEDADTRSYKAYTHSGEIWQEGKFTEGLRVLQIHYRYPQNETVFRSSYLASDEVVRIEAYRFNPEGYTLACKMYDKDNKVINDYIDNNNSYTDFEYSIAKIISALKEKDYRAAKKRYKNLESPSTEKESVIKEIFEPIIAYLADNEKASLKLFNACIDLKYKTTFGKNLTDIISLGTTAYIENLFNAGKIEEATQLVHETNDEGKLGENLENPLWEWSTILAIKSGMYTLSSLDGYFLRQLKVLEKAGKRTSASDFLMETTEAKAYNDFIENLPKYSSYDKEEKVLTFSDDVVWNNNLFVNELSLYYPEITDIDTIIINGNLKVNGNFTNVHEFDTDIYYPDMLITGNLEADSVTQTSSSLEIGGSLKTKRFIYLHGIDTYKGKCVEVKKLIDSPLFVIFGGLKMKHTGGFSDNCLHIATFSSSHKYIKVHHPENLLADICKNHGPYYNINFEKLLELFEAGKPIFKNGYDPTASATAGWDKIEEAKKLIGNNKPEAALKVLGKIKETDTREQNIIAFERDYYKAVIYKMQGEQENAAKINKLCKAMWKLYKSGEISSQPRWEMLHFVKNNLLATETEKGNSKKIVELLSEINNGDTEYYTRKAGLLWEQGKTKDALFPAYITTRYYNGKLPDTIIKSKEFIEFAAVCDSDKFILPKNYKNKYDKAIDKTPFAEYIYDDEEESGVVVFKGDVFWNNDLTAIEEIVQMPDKVHCNSLVIFGDLYVKGELSIHQIDLFVTGNLFVDGYYQADSKVWCLGNVFCKNDYRIKVDIGGAKTKIYGNISAPVIAIHPEEFEVYGKVDPQTICIGINGYEFVDADIKKVYTENDLQVDIEDSYESLKFLTEKLQKGDLLK